MDQFDQRRAEARASRERIICAALHGGHSYGQASSYARQHVPDSVFDKIDEDQRATAPLWQPSYAPAPPVHMRQWAPVHNAAGAFRPGDIGAAPAFGWTASEAYNPGDVVQCAHEASAPRGPIARFNAWLDGLIDRWQA